MKLEPTHGEHNRRAKLSAAQVHEIRNLPITRERMTLTQIAEKYGVSRHTISRIARGTRWQTV